MGTDQKLKAELCRIMKELYAEKILTDIGGNLSFRSEEDDQYLYITPSGMKKDLVEPEHLVKMSIDGEIFDDFLKRGPSIEYPMHLAIMKEDEDFKFIIHSHAPYATSLSLIENPPKFPQLTAELSYLIPDIVIVPYKRSGSVELGETVAEALWESSIVILENHGVVAVSKEGFQDAAIKTRALEEYLRLYLLATLFGGKIREFPGF